MTISGILQEFKQAANSLYGARLQDLVLYGSWARGEATDDSDIDVVVVLAGDVIPGQEIDRMIDLITDANLEHGVLISVYPVSAVDYVELVSPLLLNVRREGMRV